jgi:hypothetical protein
MSLFNWFPRKPAAQTTATPERPAGLGQADAATALAPVAAPLSQAAASRKIERLAHREFLYSVVRDAMIRAGVLAASYKFKVLSLDARGRQYLIMMDVVQPLMDAMTNLSEIETSMIQAAKARHDLQVTAVYWRANEQVASGQATSASAPASAPKPGAAFEPLRQDEVAAFKRALASVAPAGVAAAPGQTVTSGRRHPAPADEFQDTQIVPSEEHVSPLGVTQYGELN